MKVKKRRPEIDFNGFVNDFLNEITFHANTINLLNEGYSKRLDELVKNYKVNLLTKENLIKARDDVRNGLMFFNRIDIDELADKEYLLYEFCSTYKYVSKKEAFRVYPSALNLDLKQSQ